MIKKTIKKAIIILATIMVLATISFVLSGQHLVNAVEEEQEVLPIREEDINVSQRIEKYINLGENEILLQQAIITEIPNNVTAREKESLKIQSIILGEEKPTGIVVLLNGKKLNSDKVNYDVTTGEIQIVNEAQELLEVSKNEYKIIYHFNKTIDEGNIPVTMKAEIAIKIYDQDEIIKKDEQEIEIAETGNVVSIQKEATSQLAKGYLYSNSDNETAFEEHNKLEISDVSPIEEIQIQDEQGRFVNGEENTFEASNIIYKSTIISKEEFLRIFGNNGEIMIEDENGVECGVINENSETDDNGNIVINYEEGKKSLKITITKPETEGSITINHVRSMKGNSGYSVEELKSFTHLNLSTILATNIGEDVANSNVTLNDTKAEAKIEMSNTNLFTLQSNENIQIIATLCSNNNEQDLYKNPYVEIILPNELEVNVKSIDKLNMDELSIESHNITKNEDGETVIQLQLVGEQTRYESYISEGLQIVVTADINIENTVPTKKSEIRMRYTNENRKDEVNSTNCEITLNSKEGMLIVSRASNYNSNGDILENIDDKIEKGYLDVYSNKKIVDVENYIINNYQFGANETVIIGQIPNIGTQTNNDESIDITFETKFASLVSVNKENVKVYYSEEINVDKDSETWKEEVEDISKIRAFKIELEGNCINPQEVIKLSYQIEIPENLEPNQRTANELRVKYQYENSEMEIYSINAFETETITMQALSEEVTEDEDLQVKMSVKSKGTTLEDGDEIYEGQTVKYTLQMTNTLDRDIYNLKLVATHTNVIYYGIKMVDAFGTEYPHLDEQQDLENKEITIEMLKAGETVTLEYQIVANSDVEEGTTTTGEIVLSGEEIETIVIPAYTNPIKQAKLKLKILNGTAIDQEIYSKNYAYPLEMYVENISGEDLSNINVNLDLPEVITFEADDEIEHIDFSPIELDIQKNNLDKKKINVTLGNLQAGETATIYVMCHTESIDLKLDKVEVNIDFSAEVDGEKYISNEASKEILQAETNITAIQEGNIQGDYVENGDNLIYTTTITNKGVIEKDITITDTLPTGVNINKAYILKDGEKIDDIAEIIYQNVGFQYTVNPQEEITLVIDTTIDSSIVEEDIISNIVKIFGDKLEVESNEVVYQLRKHSNNNNGANAEETKKITGTTWIDSDENGVKDEREPEIKDMNVILINQEDSSMVSQVRTAQDGSYSFDNVKQGKYLVIFLYDTTKYKVTEYKKSGISERKNSDVIVKQITLNGQVKTVAITDTLNLEQVNLTNIDAGFIESKKFDLKLDKYISKVIVQDKKGTNVKAYDNTQFAKIELNSRNIAGTTVLVEYSIKVTNEGEISGYANEIADYIPENFEFKSEINKAWYQSQNGKVCTQELSNQIINPGETKTITLTLTKTMTQNNTGTSVNIAEISKSSNNTLVEDIDSISGNKKEGEDDISKAELIISIATGEMILYITLIIITVTSIGIGVYFINKKVLGLK